MKLFTAVGTLAIVGSLTTTYAGQGLVLEKKVLSLAAARKIVAAAEAEANARGVGVVIAVVDSSRTIIELTRMDTAPVSDGSVTFIPAARVTTAFAKGEPLVENGLYKVHASRREAPGMAEVHARTDRTALCTSRILPLGSRSSLKTRAKNWRSVASFGWPVKRSN